MHSLASTIVLTFILKVQDDRRDCKCNCNGGDGSGTNASNQHILPIFKKCLTWNTFA